MTMIVPALILPVNEVAVKYLENDNERTSSAELTDFHMAVRPDPQVALFCCLVVAFHFRCWL